MQLLTGIWKRRKWWLILIYLPLVTGAFALILALPPLYRASTTVLVGHSDILQDLVMPNQSDGMEQRLTVARQELLSRGNLQTLVEKHDLYPEMRGSVPVQAIIDRMRRDISIERGAPAGNFQQTAYPITIGYRTWDPDLAAAVANDLAASYSQKNSSLRVRQANSTTEFLRQQLEQSRQRLEESETRLNAFKNRHLGELPEQQGINLATLERLNAELTLNGEKQVQLLDRYNSLLSGGVTGDMSGGRLPRLVLLRQELVELRARYTNQHPEVTRVRDEIAALESAQDELLQESDGENRLSSLQGTLPDTERQLEELQRRETELNQHIDELEIRLEYMPALEQELRQLTRDYDIARAEYTRYQEQYRNASMVQSLESREEQQFTVLETALPPEFAVAPGSLGLMLMSSIMAIGFAGGIIFLLEQFDTSFHSIGELHAFTNLPVLSSVGVIETPWDKVRRTFNYSIGALVFAVLLIVVALLFYFLGDHLGKQLVWLVAGRSV